MGACYLIGVVFYVSKFPECKYPGKFDRVYFIFLFIIFILNLLIYIF